MQLTYFKFWLETSALLKRLKQNYCSSQRKDEGKIILYPYAVAPESSYSVTSRGIVTIPIFKLGKEISCGSLLIKKSKYSRVFSFASVRN